ncbi:LysR family transcriptional regulator [Paenibacillus hodogayensis]|uniref:LysR family transcriptional regulator n=1 Tax=Paenibacillus hodogayensis TaxID=279208 RepID=A0ABV5VRR7_9BACL
MELTLLRTFTETARLLHITRAADALGYAQSSITAQIRKLEQHYGVPLFERNGRGIRLTPAGRELLDYARRILDLEEESRQAVSADIAGSLTVGTIESMAAFYLPPYIRRMKELFPRTGLLLQTGNEAELLQGVQTGQYDAGIWLERQKNDPELVRIVLREEPLLLVARPDHPLAGTEQIQPDDFARHAWVAPERSCSYRNMFVELLAEHGIKPQVSCELGSVEAIKRCVLHGLGLALLPACAVAAELKDGRLRKLAFSPPELRIYVQLVYPADRWVSKTLAALTAMLQLSEAD